MPSFCDPAEAQLAHSGTLCAHNKFYEAELIRCRTLALAAPRKPGLVVRDAGDAAAAARSGPLLSWLQCEAKRVVEGGKEKEKGARPGALISTAFLL